MPIIERSSAVPARKSGLPMFAIASAIGGALMLLYGWKRRTTRIGRFTSALGMSLLARALANPRIAEKLGPMQSYLSIPLAAGQKLLA